jgi:acetyltransferase
MFNPTSVAVVGASDREGSVGGHVLKNLLDYGYEGPVYPVNPKRKEVFGLKCFASLQDVRDQCDLVVMAIPIDQVVEALKECPKVHCAGAVILSAGGKETGLKGKDIELEIQQQACRSRVRIIGPNCLGILSSKARLNATFSRQTPLTGKLALLSQSGAICSTIVDMAVRRHIGFRTIVSLGSLLDVDFGDMIDYLGTKGDVTSIIMYVESLTNFRKFMSAARAVSKVKPIVVLKAGRTSAGARAANSHTGALAGEDAIYEAAFKRTGIVRVKTFEELFDCAELLARQPRPPSPNLGIVTNAGGMGVIAVDALSDYGIEPVPLGRETVDALNEFLPKHWSHGNPVDILGDATAERYTRTAEILTHAPEIKGLLFIHVPQALSSPGQVARALVNMFASKRYPVFTSWLGGMETEEARNIFHAADIPTFDTTERAVRAFMDLYRYGRNLEAIQQVPGRLPKSLGIQKKAAEEVLVSVTDQQDTMLTEHEAKKVLAAYGIPVNRTELAGSPEEAVQKAEKIGYPVALKIHSRNIVHKTEARGVQLNLRDEAEILKAYEAVMSGARQFDPHAGIEGVTLQPMIPRVDVELILGAKKDKGFGPVILFGTGGVLTEVFRDRAIGFPPLNRTLARMMICETRAYELLQGFRNMAGADIPALEEIMIRLAQLLVDFPEVEELDINPLAVINGGFLALDARMAIDPEPVARSPFHLVISPYPDQYESTAWTKDGVKLLIRPIKPEDAPLLTDLFEHLSPESVYFRFFRPMKRLPMDMLIRFTQVDYDREIALVAIQEAEEGERMLGAARVIQEPHSQKAEFSVLVCDECHGRGIGAALLRKCLTIAQERGIKHIWGVVLPGNSQMLALGRKLGFEIKRCIDSNDVLLSIDLEALKEGSRHGPDELSAELKVSAW